MASQSPEKSNADLRHPVPDLQSLQGAYIGNIERLEEHAERMSEPGSDLGEEIRKTYSELKRSDSRKSSFLSSHAVDEPTRQFSTRSRNVSTSSHANSIVDLNGNARWGGYSPGGYITSPVGSLRSGTSWSNPPASIQRQRSGSKASRLGQVVRPEEVLEEYRERDAYPGSPHSLSSPPLPIREDESSPPSAQRKVSSFTRIYDEIANGLPEDLRNSVILSQPTDRDIQHSPEDSKYHYAHHNLPDRPPTAASTDTTHQARTLWQDFDGVHCPDTVPEEEPVQSSNGHSRQSSNTSFMMRSNPELPQMGAPPPGDNMVFYPAPVPRMLNLPKRLSQLPSSSVQAKRRTQLLESMQQENRKSMPMLGEPTQDTMQPSNRKSRQSMMALSQDNIVPPNRKSRQSLMGLPPQLRASAYFDQPAPAQEFAVKGESAEDTLDSILDASARAPVSAFTDHPFAGHVGNEVYGPEHKRKSSKFPDPLPKPEETKRRSSFNVLDTKRNSSGDPLNKLKKRNSSADMDVLVTKASESRMSLGDELDEHDEHARGPPIQVEDEPTPTRRSLDDDHSQLMEDHFEDETLESDPEEEQYFGAPTTLLAELQMRKAKQKTRNLNYATLVEQGMMTSHRTLLEMDDMAEKEKQKRLRKKVHLAWEAQHEDDESDDDVPLGVLYNQGGQQQDWNQPLGLIAQRELEDNEPLSQRRNRLRGGEPQKRNLSPDKRGTQYLGASPSQGFLAVPTTTTPGPESEEDEGETLGERMRRLKDKQMLEAALGDDVRKSTVSSDFATEMLSKLGGPDGEEKKAEPPQPTPSPGAEEEETLGQRRARLQAEAAARGDTPTASSRPTLRSSMSLADILSANPLDTTNSARKVSNEMLVSHLPQGSLLHQNVIAEERRKAQRLTQNMRASSYGDPLLRGVAPKNDEDQPLAGKIQAYKNKMAGITAPNQPGMMMNGMPGMNMGMGMGMGMNGMGIMSSPNLAQQQQQNMMNMPMNMNMMGGMQQMNNSTTNFQYPQMRQSSMMGMNGMQMPMGMNGMGGMQMPMNGMNGMNGMPMNMQMGMGMGMPMGMQSPMMAMPPMDPRQRDQIDRWMQGIRH